ncbi:MAG: amidase [Rhodospirillales bacterium]|nr:amidase [Rhodospirillales bacterium]
MNRLPNDPLAEGGIAGFQDRLRRAETSAEETCRAYLARIEALESRLGAFEHMAADSALELARRIDRDLGSGHDPGPLAGVPVVLKDLIEVSGMPTTAGSNVDVSDSIGPEGGFVKRLRKAGCVLLGKTKTVEFARGAAGISNVRGTPVNPWDLNTHRIPGGSSSGSAVAMAAGMCGFAVGTDTGGSVRGPASFCGVFGLKPSLGLWPTDGVFPNSPSFDTIGPMTRSAHDGAFVFAALTGTEMPEPASFEGLTFGRPENHFFDGLDEAVAEAVEAAIRAIEKAGAKIVPFDMPEVAERETILRAICARECIDGIGRERFLARRDDMDPVTVARTRVGLEVTDAEYREVRRLTKRLSGKVRDRMRGLDGLLTPTTTLLAPTVADITDLESGLELEARLGLNTHPVSFFGLCSTTSPIQHLTGAPLPIGLQMVCPGGEDAKLMSLARAFEDLVGPPPVPDPQADSVP